MHCAARACDMYGQARVKMPASVVGQQRWCMLPQHSRGQVEEGVGHWLQALNTDAR